MLKKRFPEDKRPCPGQHICTFHAARSRSRSAQAPGKDATSVCLCSPLLAGHRPHSQPTCPLKHTPWDPAVPTGVRHLHAALLLQLFPALQQGPARGQPGSPARSVRGAGAIRAGAEPSRKCWPCPGPRTPCARSETRSLRSCCPSVAPGTCGCRYDAKRQTLSAAANLQFERCVEIFILVIYQEFNCPCPEEVISS